MVMIVAMLEAPAAAARMGCPVAAAAMRLNPTT
jgi:hypothetical protein